MKPASPAPPAYGLPVRGGENALVSLRANTDGIHPSLVAFYSGRKRHTPERGHRVAAILDPP